MPRRSFRSLARPLAASEPALEDVPRSESAGSPTGDETTSRQGATVEVEEVEGRNVASDPSRGHPAPVEGEQALEGPTWQDEFESVEELYRRFHNFDHLRGRQANEVGLLRRQVGLYERTAALLLTTRDPFEQRALLQAIGLIHEPKAHASVEQMLDVGERAHEGFSHAV